MFNKYCVHCNWKSSDSENNLHDEGPESVSGIDIEMQRDKILRIAHKFTPIEEYKTLANAEAIMRKLTIVWGAKESLYKIYAQQGLSFLRHIDVMDFAFADGRTVAEILYKGKKTHYEVEFLEFEGFTCVYALKMMGG